jgi:hypothetical protein
MAEVATAPKLEKLPIKFQLGEVLIDGVVVRPITMKQFAGVVTAAQAMKEPEAWLARMRRQRMAAQAQFHVNGSVMPVNIPDLAKLGIKDARTIIEKLDENEGVPGKIINDGDGIEKAIVYQLGTPIQLGKDKPPVKELEFHAEFYGDVEDIMAADHGVTQTVMLIQKLAKPLGTTLTALPSWALDTLTIADGLFIMNEILPRFLGSPDE